MVEHVQMESIHLVAHVEKDLEEETARSTSMIVDLIHAEIMEDVWTKLMVTFVDVDQDSLENAVRLTLMIVALITA